MKTVIALFLMSHIAAAQEISKDAFNQYEDQRKDKAVASLCWALLPGGGHFYAESGTGIVFLLATAGAVGIVLAEKSDDKEPLFGIISIIGVRLYDLTTTFDSVDEYNQQLRAKLNMVYDPGRTNLSLCLSLDL